MRKLLLLLIIFLMNISMGSAQAETRLWRVTNTTQLLTAVAELKANPSSFYGGTIILEPGWYNITSTIEFDSKNQVNIIGSGWGTILKKNGNGDAIRFVNSGFCMVKNILILGDTSATTGSGIVFQGSGCNTAEYCRILQFPKSGIRFEAGSSGSRVTNCHFIGNKEHQLYCYTNNDFFIYGNQFGTHSVTPLTGTFLDFSSAGTYANNFHWSNEVAFRMVGSAYNRIENNRFEMSDKEGIILGDPGLSSPNYYNIFTGNTIHTNSMSQSGQYSAVIAYNTILNTFKGNQIFSWNSNSYLTKYCMELVSGCSTWIITDNIMMSYTTSAMTYSGSDHKIEDNIIY